MCPVAVTRACTSYLLSQKPVPNKSNSMYTSKRNGWNVFPSERRGSLSSPPSSSVFFHVNESHLHKHSLLHPHPHMVLGLKTGQLYLTVEIERREQAACSLLTSAQFCFLSWWSQLRLCSWRGRCVLPSRPAAEMEVNPLCLWSAWGVLSPPPVASLLVKNIILSPSFT